MSEVEIKGLPNGSPGKVPAEISEKRMKQLRNVLFNIVKEIRKGVSEAVGISLEPEVVLEQ